MVSGVFSIPLEAQDSRVDATRREKAARGSVLREYIGSDENRLVQIAADSLLDRNPQFNPIVFYGPTGTGKSFLAIGLAQRWREKYPDHSVIVTCGPDYARRFANALDTNHLVSFREKHRSADLFVLDDVHLMQEKRAAQDELTRNIDVLIRHGKAVLVTAKGPPTTDDSLPASLRSRLTCGLAVPLAIPGAAARVLLLQRLAALHGIRFSDAAIELLAGPSLDSTAHHFTVPQLNHAVIELAHGEDSQRDLIDLDQVHRFLNEQLSRQAPTLGNIASLVSQYFSISSRDLRGPSRRRNVVRARGVAMLLARNATGKSLYAVGRFFGNRDHTTVLHSCRRTELLRKTDPEIRKALEELHNQLKTL